MDEQLKALVAQGLQARKAGSEIAAHAIAEIEQDARHPDLKAALQRGSETAKQWQQRIEAALTETGDGARSGEDGNAIIAAHYEVSKKICANAKDDRSRDLGIIAAGQLALHYWIGSFGTQHSYAEAAGLTQGAAAMRQCAEEAKMADEQHTELARKILQAA